MTTVVGLLSFEGEMSCSYENETSFQLNIEGPGFRSWAFLYLTVKSWRTAEKVHYRRFRKETAIKGSRSLTTKEVRRVLAACQNIRERTLCILALNLALRVGELTSLVWGDVWQYGKPVPMLYLTRDRTKGKKARTVPVNSNAAKAIRALRRKAEGQALSVETSTTLFPSRKHGALGVRQANEIIARIFERAKIGGKVSPHSFRKTAGTLLSKNTPLPVIQEILGHADISTTRKYISVGMDSLRDAANRLSRAY